MYACLKKTTFPARSLRRLSRRMSENAWNRCAPCASSPPGDCPPSRRSWVLGKDPGSWFPGSYIQFVRYDGEDVTDPIKDQKEIRGTLTQQLRQIDEILKVHISTGDAIRGAPPGTSGLPRGSLERIDPQCGHPPELREQQYAGPRILVLRSRPDRQPGPTYGEVTRHNLGDPGVTAYRNPTIAEAMKSLGFMERFGTGIQRARAALRDNGNLPPEFAAEDPFVSVTVGAGT